MYVLLRSRLNEKISLSFKRDFEKDHSKLRILVDSRLENQRIWRFVMNSTIFTYFSFAGVREVYVHPSRERLVVVQGGLSVPH